MYIVASHPVANSVFMGTFRLFLGQCTVYSTNYSYCTEQNVPVPNLAPSFLCNYLTSWLDQAGRLITTPTHLSWASKSGALLVGGIRMSKVRRNWSGTTLAMAPRPPPWSGSPSSRHPGWGWGSMQVAVSPLPAGQAACWSCTAPNIEKRLKGTLTVTRDL